MEPFFRAFMALLIATFVSGDGVYTPSSQFCCNGTAHDERSYHYCCNTELVSQWTTTCCRGEQVSHLNVLHHELDCCYDSQGTPNVFYPKKEECCQGKILTKPNSYGIYHCCGAQLYDFYSQICCDGIIYDFQFNVECCGTQLMQINKNRKTECCGDVVIDTTEKLCCKTKRSKQDPVKGDPRKPSYNVEIYDRISSIKQKCCGLQIYDYNQELCCNEKEQPPRVLQLPTLGSNDGSATCCGNSIIIDRTTEICCANQVHQRPSLDIECCNKEILFDHKTQICCGNNLYDKENNRDQKTACCKSAGKLYDPAINKCCGDEIVTKSDHVTESFFSGTTVEKTECCIKH